MSETIISIMQGLGMNYLRTRSTDKMSELTKCTRLLKWMVANNHAEQLAEALPPVWEVSVPVIGT